eukprot:TRINITY_DN1116_c0_g1_i1.p1 TRINITY_DN1116_c0_g1~~TRINITY_DN1116_c0_g1_i1.p1  ORF type:complete len:332 (+),score=38.95 TRINITY_DN1116_c0_g1_i1:159-1154(+)
MANSKSSPVLPPRFYTLAELHRTENLHALGYSGPNNELPDRPPCLEDFEDDIAPPAIERPDHGRAFPIFDRRHESELAEADFWVSVDTGVFAFRPVPNDGGQRYIPHVPEEEDQEATMTDSLPRGPDGKVDVKANNRGGFHQAVVDLGPEPAGTSWAILARMVTTDSLAKPGSLQPQETRVQQLILARSDHKFRSTPKGSSQPDECRGLAVVIDNCDFYEHQHSCDICDDGVSIRGDRYDCQTCANYNLCAQCFFEKKHDQSHPVIMGQRLSTTRIELTDALFGNDDGPEGKRPQVAVPCGLGAGLYPVKVHRDELGSVRAIYIQFLGSGK